MQLKRDSVVSPGNGVRAPGKDRAALENQHVPVFDDLLERIGLTRPVVAIAVGAALYLLLLLGIYIDGYKRAFVDPAVWKDNLEPVAILTYVLLVHYFLDSYGRKAVLSLRPIIKVEDKAFNAFVNGQSAIIFRYQWLAMTFFAVLSVPLLRDWEDWSRGFQWSMLVSTVTSLFEYALIGSFMYLVVARNRFFTRLFKQPTSIDVFDPAPVRPMGRWGLSVSAAIMGGITISALLVGDAEDLLTLDHLPMYLVATAAAIVSFFGSLFSTHRLLVGAKERELGAIRSNLSAMYRELKLRREGGRLDGPDQTRSTEMANTITAWLGYERRIAEAQEWPYTANNLRGLFATVLLPLTVTIIQQIIL